VHRRVALRIEHHLRNAAPVAKIDEHHHAVVAPALNPAVQHHGLPDIRLVQFAAPMGSYLHAALTFFIGRSNSPPVLFSRPRTAIAIVILPR
jgi:hypothetical protein